MVTFVEYNRRGSLLEELAEIDDLSEHRSRLFEVIGGIRDILVPEYSDGIIGVKKLEHRLALRTSYTSEALEIFSRGVKVPLQRELNQLDEYSLDTVNEVFVGLYNQLINEINSRPLYGLVDHNRFDHTNTDLVELMDQLEIFNSYSTWVNQNERVFPGLDQHEREKASKQFRDLKKSASDFKNSFNILMYQDNNIGSSYSSFNVNKSQDNYESTRDVVEKTIEDCNRIVSKNGSHIRGKSWEATIKLASNIKANAEFYLLKMGFDMYREGNMENPEIFKQDLMDRAVKMRYLHDASIITNPSILQLSANERNFYKDILSSKPLN